MTHSRVQVQQLEVRLARKVGDLAHLKLCWNHLTWNLHPKRAMVWNCPTVPPTRPPRPRRVRLFPLGQQVRHPTHPPNTPSVLAPWVGLLFSINWVIVYVTWSSIWVDYQRMDCLGWRHLDLTMCFLGKTVGNTVYFTDIWKSVLSGPCLYTIVHITHEAAALLVSLISALTLRLSLDSLSSGTTIFSVYLAPQSCPSQAAQCCDIAGIWSLILLFYGHTEVLSCFGLIFKIYLFLIGG